MNSTPHLSHPRPTSEADDTRPAKRQRISPDSTGSSDLGERATLFPGQLQRQRDQATPTPTLPRRPAKASDVLGFVHSKLGEHQPSAVNDYVASLRDAYLALNYAHGEPEVRGVEEECKLWLARSEVGLLVLDATAECSTIQWATASDVEEQVDRAVGKGLVLLQKHSSLRQLKLPFTLASARLAVIQKKPRHALATIRRFVATSQPSDPPAQVYRGHLALVGHLLAAENDIDAALIALEALQKAATKRKDDTVVTLAKVERLRILACAERWTEAREALELAETALGLIFPADPVPPSNDSVADTNQPASTSQSTDSQQSASTSSSTPAPKPTSKQAPALTTTTTLDPSIASTPWRAALAIYTLMLGTLLHTHFGVAAKASARVSALHKIMDRRPQVQSGLVDVPLRPYNTDRDAHTETLQVQTGHYAALFRLTFLVTAVSKRDPMVPGAASGSSKQRDSVGGAGGEPKRRIFAREGLAVADKKDELVEFAPASSLRTARTLNDSLAHMRAQLLFELIGIAILRHEFDEADSRLAQLTAYLRNTSSSGGEGDMWGTHAGLVMLYYGNLAQAQLRPRRASACYGAAAKLARGDDVRLAARACDLALRVGFAHHSETPIPTEPVTPVKNFKGTKRKRGSATATGVTAEMDEMKYPELKPVDGADDDVRDVIRMCLREDDPEHEGDGQSASLRAVGHVLAACTSDEVLRVKNHLKSALELATTAHDNALRAPILALTSAQYTLTAPAHAHVMLRRARDLARELGAAPLCAWIVRQIIDVSKLNGKESRVPKLQLELDELEDRVKGLRERPAAPSKKRR